ncbi:hypothetical protein JX266_006936 [Neoarthrinium moseri]|nr:hypothetical protein JX266_006936 [Neoarthrinium moseri]
MSELETLILHGHYGTPNPLKVMILLEELGLPYKHVSHARPPAARPLPPLTPTATRQVQVDITKVKEEPYTQLNPNGRLPTLEDPNTGLVLWESAPIVEYLVDTYDKAGRLTLRSFPESYHLKQFLALQSSGQGPYYGQWVFFARYLPGEAVAIARYKDQLLRVWSVLDKILEGKEYLVGGKCTYADLSFVAWEDGMRVKFPEFGLEKRASEYPNYNAWYQRLIARPAVAKALRINREEMAKAAAK